MELPAPRSLSELLADSYIPQACFDAGWVQWLDPAGTVDPHLPTHPVAVPGKKNHSAIAVDDVDGSLLTLHIHIPSWTVVTLVARSVATIDRGVWSWQDDAYHAVQQFGIADLSSQAVPLGDVPAATDGTAAHTSPHPTRQQLSAAARAILANHRPALILPTRDGTATVCVIDKAPAARLKETLEWARSAPPGSPNIRRSMLSLSRFYGYPIAFPAPDVYRFRLPSAPGSTPDPSDPANHGRPSIILDVRTHEGRIIGLQPFRETPPSARPAQS